MHLHVTELADADAVYAEGLGFHRMVWRYAGALFFDAGGHHDLAADTWTRAASAPHESDAKLQALTIVLPSADDVAALREHVMSRGLAHTDQPTGMLLGDPWGTPLRIRAWRREASDHEREPNTRGLAQLW